MYAFDKCIVGLYTEDDRVNAKLLDDNASIFENQGSGLKDADGKPVPMKSTPCGCQATRMAIGEARTSFTPTAHCWCRSIHRLVPDKVALETFRDAMPGWKVIGIDCEGLIAKRGALHCISRQVPQLPTGK